MKKTNTDIKKKKEIITVQTFKEKDYWTIYNEGWDKGFLEGREYEEEHQKDMLESARTIRSYNKYGPSPINWKHIFVTFFLALVLGVAIASPFINSLFN